MERISVDRLHKCKRSFVTRNARLEQPLWINHENIRPHCGDLVLARIESLGNHKRLELTTGRRAPLSVGDEILVAYGNRYATDQFEAEIPETMEDCDLVAAGGIASRALTWSSAILPPTRIKPIGVLTSTDGLTLNLNQFALTRNAAGRRLVPTIAIVGTGMNAGKTTTVASFVKGLKLLGHCVGVAKITGTGSGGDLWSVFDAGADYALDFTDAGLASTYLSSAKCLEVATETLIAELQSAGATVVLLEIADGLLQRETDMLIHSKTFGRMVDGYLLAARCPLGVISAYNILSHCGEVYAVSGRFTASSLAIREAAGRISVPILTKEQLQEGELINDWLRLPDQQLIYA